MVNDKFENWLATQEQEFFEPTNDVKGRWLSIWQAAIASLQNQEPVIIDSVCSALVNGKREAIPMGTELYLAPPQSLAVQEESAPSYEMVLAYLYSLQNEADRRGGMFPQDRDEQDDARDRLHKVADTVKWYGEQGHPTPKAVLEKKELRARNQQPLKANPTSQDDVKESKPI